MVNLFLGFDEMKEISDLTHAPLVLHGGSGIPDSKSKKAIANGNILIKREHLSYNKVGLAGVRKISILTIKFTILR